MQAVQVTKCCSLALICRRLIQCWASCLAPSVSDPEVFLSIGQSPCRHWFVQVSPDRHQALLQLDEVAYWFLVHALLKAAPNLVIDRVEVWNVRRSQVRWNEICCFVAQKFDRRTCTLHGEPARSRLLWCYCCYDNRAGGSRPYIKFSVPVSRQLNEVSFCKNTDEFCLGDVMTT